MTIDKKTEVVIRFDKTEASIVEPLVNGLLQEGYEIQAQTNAYLDVSGHFYLKRSQKHSDD